MLPVWLGEAIRPTRDADLLGFGDINVQTLSEIFNELCVMEVEPDRLEFDATSLRVAPIRVEDAYGGQRATLFARLGAARLKVQVDVGIGDAVFPRSSPYASRSDARVCPCGWKSRAVGRIRPAPARHNHLT